MHFAEGSKQLFKAICILQKALNKAEEGGQKQQLKMCRPSAAEGWRAAPDRAGEASEGPNRPVSPAA